MTTKQTKLSRQRARRVTFQKAVAAVNGKAFRGPDQGGSPRFTIGRKSRRSLARAYALGAWRSRDAAKATA